MKQLAIDSPLAQGLDLAFVGMSIVFTALVLVSIFIAVLPRILGAIHPYIPPAQLHTQSHNKENDAPAIAAAIGFALHARRQND
ncbi:MAG: OadG family protein [Gemmatimonadota bacterium]|nr:OadG family protein [Gemmatimonadota bacterium]